MAVPTPVILLPPSEGKAAGGEGPPVDWSDGRFGVLADNRLTVRDAVRRVLRRTADAERLLGVKGAYLERALAEWAELDDSPTVPAAARYSGVVWGAVDVPGMDATTRRRLMSRVVIPSGLWGLVGAADGIPAYRLKMGARVGSLGVLSRWWLPRVSPLLATRAGRGAIIDLLPQEHAAALDPSVLRPGALVRVEIVEDGPVGRRAVGHAGKAVKGRLARAILGEDARTADDIAAIAVDGLCAPSIVRGDITTVTFRSAR